MRAFVPRFSYVRCKGAVIDRTGFKGSPRPPRRSSPRRSFRSFFSLPPRLLLSFSPRRSRGQGIEATKRPENRGISERNERGTKYRWWRSRRRKGRSREREKGERAEGGGRQRRTSSSTFHEISSIFFRYFLSLFIPSASYHAAPFLATPRGISNVVSTTVARRVYVVRIKAYLGNFIQGTRGLRSRGTREREGLGRKHCTALVKLSRYNVCRVCSEAGAKMRVSASFPTCLEIMILARVMAIEVESSRSFNASGTVATCEIWPAQNVESCDANRLALCARCGTFFLI